MRTGREVVDPSLVRSYRRGRVAPLTLSRLGSRHVALTLAHNVNIAWQRGNLSQTGHGGLVHSSAQTRTSGWGA